MRKKADRAEELFRRGYNCAQSVLGAFAPEIGMTEEQLMRLASPFGAGIGALREVCGAVSGMALAAGLMSGYCQPADASGKQALYQQLRLMAAEFEARQSSLICRDLLHLAKGELLPEPAVRTEDYYQQRPCLRAVRDAAEIAESFLLSGGPPPDQSLFCAPISPKS